MALDKDYVLQPVGGNLQAFCSRDPEVLLYGPAGTGKTICLLHKLDFCCSKYKGIRCLLTRKTRTGLTESVMPSFEGKVLREGTSVLNRGLQRKNRTSYLYPNGSEIVLAGLDDPEKILSTEYDIIYVNEATSISFSEYETLIGRNRNFQMPYQQIIMDCNPANSRHWLKMRASQPRLDINGKPSGKNLLTMIKSSHKDNPFYWDKKKQAWTEQGLIYISRLSNFAGIRRDRFFEGEWTNAEGVVYKEFDRTKHVLTRAQFPSIPAHWNRYVAIDFGYQSPFVALFGAVDPQTKCLYIYREWFMTQMTVEEHAAVLKRLMSGEPNPVAIICDHDPEARRKLEECNGWSTVSAPKGKGSIEIGIQEVKNRLQLDHRGIGGLYIMEDALVRKDQPWEDAGNPACLVDELESYSYKPLKEGVNPKEEPQDKWNHGCDALSYMCLYISNNMGEWLKHTPLPRPDPMVLTTDPMQERKWFPFPRLFPDAGKGGGLI